MIPETGSDGEKHRRSIRLKNRDYALPDLYFVTICAHERRSIFGSIVDAWLAPSALGQIARESWTAICSISRRSRCMSL
jgi:hypothetical protein